MSKDITKQNGSKNTPNQRGGGPGGAIGRPVEKAKDFKGTIKKLVSYLKPHKRSLFFVFLFAIMSTVFTIVGPKILGQATTLLVEGVMAKMQHLPNAAIDFNGIARILSTVLILYVFSSIFNYTQQYIMARVSQRTVYQMRQNVDEKLRRLPLKYYDGHAHGDILSRVTNDIDTISTTLQQSLTQLVTSVVTIIGVLAMMLSIDWKLTLIALVTIPLSVIITIVIAKYSQGYYKGQQKYIGELNGHIEEVYSGHNVVKAFGKEADTIKEFEVYNDQLYTYGWKAQFMSGIIMPALSFVGNIGYILVAVVGAIFSINYGLTVGNIQAFLQYSQQFTQPITQTANIANILQSTVAAAERVFELLEEEEEVVVKNPQTIAKPAGKVDFEHVNFGYNKDKIIIHDLNVRVKPGQTIAIVGPTGAGKTTLINLLMRFYELNSGKILVDDVDIAKMNRETLRSMFGMVLQDTWLFNGTIHDNLAYANADASDEDIINAAKMASADHFIRTLPKGYQTEINEEASNISQGQKQLLTIARAILANPTILILDEATSSVDTRTEILIQTAMDKLMENRTSFVIAHRLSTIKNADTILVMDKGEIIEQGAHDELLAKNGFYADLYNSQFSEEAE